MVFSYDELLSEQVDFSNIFELILQHSCLGSHMLVLGAYYLI